jgi:hypothetical protein
MGVAQNSSAAILGHAEKEFAGAEFGFEGIEAEGAGAVGERAEVADEAIPAVLLPELSASSKPFLDVS